MSKGVRIGNVLAGAAWLSMTGFAAQAQDIVDHHLQSHALRVAVDYTNWSERSKTWNRNRPPEDSGYNDSGIVDHEADDPQESTNPGRLDALLTGEKPGRTWGMCSATCGGSGGGDNNGADDHVVVEWSMNFGGAQGIAGMSDGSVVDYSDNSAGDAPATGQDHPDEAAWAAGWVVGYTMEWITTEMERKRTERSVQTERSPTAWGIPGRRLMTAAATKVMVVAAGPRS